MRRHNILVLFLLLAIALVAGLYFFLLGEASTELSETWYLLLLVILAGIALAVRPRHYVVPVLSLMLTSIGVFSSLISPHDLGLSGGWQGHLGSFFWDAFKWLWPFAFIHFALLFPVRTRWFEQKPHRFILLYIPYFFILIAVHFQMFVDLSTNVLPYMVFPLGFVIGIGIFVRQYLFALTAAERNRLRLILIGCAAGLTPLIVYLLGEQHLPKAAWYFSNGLFPLLPMSLIVAVLKKNFSEIGPVFQKLMVIVLVAAGLVTSILLCYLAVTIFWKQVTFEHWMIAAAVLLLLILPYPLSRWAYSYVATRFDSALPSEVVTKKGPITFSPVRPNPFIVGNPVRDPDMFFGRREEFEFIRSKIRSQRQGLVIVLTGERRTGKSSILYQILNRNLGEGYVPVLLDVQGLVVASDLEFLDALATEILKVVPAGPQKHHDTLLRTETPHLAFTSFIDSALERIEGRHLLLLFDEYELIEDKIDSGKLSRDIPGYLNSVLERQPRLSLIMTGSRPFAAKPLWSGLLGKSFYREISFLNWNDARDLLVRPLEGKVLFAKGLTRECLRLTNGHPFFTQLLGQTVVDVVNEREEARVDKSILRDAVRRIIEHPPPQLLYQWSGFSSSEKFVLASLASLLSSDRDFVSGERVERVLESLPQKYRCSLDSVQTRILLEQLRSRRVLDRDQTRYRFTMDLIRCWVKTEQSVWNVLGEFRGSA